ncbi:MAG: hypothetical protein M1827_005311 [Pycnora praestabilis]|nr:MAG: hypothetical protein M1827_005311 [Pycnora praestabilis]
MTARSTLLSKTPTIVSLLANPASRFGRPQSPCSVVGPQKALANLQLPSFELLGIAAPHPDRAFNARYSTSKLDKRQSAIGCELHSPGLDALDLDFAESPNGTIRKDISFGAGSPQCGWMSMLTPPEEGRNLDWTTPLTIGSETVLSNPTTLLELTPMQRSLPINSAADPEGGEEAGNASVREIQPSFTADDDMSQTRSRTEEGYGNEQKPQLSKAIETLVAKIAISGVAGYAVRVLSHALPCPSSTEQNPPSSPSPTSSLAMTSPYQESIGSKFESSSAFPSVINAIHETLRHGPMPCIHITHAVPPRFNLADLPSSPPGTPNLSSGGEDYFSTMVFSSAVPLVDARNVPGRAMTPIPSSPHPIVPPSSMHISLVERYIPPRTSQDYLDLFSPTNSSILLDRLIELSPEGGSLLFIYPTKKGGRIFATDYLAPILDPILRAMVVVNEFSADLANMLGRMEAVEQMLEFDALRRKLGLLCRQLNRDSTMTRCTDHSGAAVNTKYSVVYSEKEEMEIHRKTWSDWWVQQETSRVREGMGRYFRKARRLPPDSDVAPINLIREIIDGVTSRPYEKDSAPKSGIEVGVFVIQRTS